MICYIWGEFYNYIILLFYHIKWIYSTDKIDLRIFIIVSTVVLENSPIDCVAKLSVEVDGNLVANPEKVSL